MKHFDSIIPASLQNKILSVSELALSDFVNDQNYGVMCGADSLNEISGVELSGFIPFQDGGYSMAAWYQSDIDSGYDFTDKQTDYNNDQYKQCYDSFLSDSDLPEGTELNEEQQTEFYEYEREWFEDGATLELKIYADISRKNFRSSEHKNGIVVLLTVEYGCNEETLYEKVYTLSEFMRMPEVEIIENIKY